MSTTKKKTNTKKALTRDRLISMYMDYMLENETAPRSVYKFAKENKIKEEEFYNFFGSFEGLQKGIWESFYEHTHAILEN